MNLPTDIFINHGKISGRTTNKPCTDMFSPKARSNLEYYFEIYKTTKKLHCLTIPVFFEEIKSQFDFSKAEIAEIIKK